MTAFLALTLAAAALGVALALGAQVRVLAERLAILEGREPSPLGQGSAGVLPMPNPLAGLRFSLSVQQDHPHPVFKGLLREALLKEEAVVDDSPLPSGGEGAGGEGQLRIEGEIVGNGYADVYFRAELTATLGGETILTLTDKPPHGDRPANLAAEVVQRLKDELAKRERRGALRELRG